MSRRCFISLFLSLSLSLSLSLPLYIYIYIYIFIFCPFSYFYSVIYRISLNKHMRESTHRSVSLLYTTNESRASMLDNDGCLCH